MIIKIIIYLTYFTCFPKFNLKSDNDLQLTKSAGSEFHSVIDVGKKENLKTSLETFGILYLKAWLLHVLNSLFGIKCSSVFMSTRLWLILYIKVNLFFFRLVLMCPISHQITCLSHLLFCRRFEGKNEQLFFQLSPRLKFFFVVWVPQDTCTLQFGSDNAGFGCFMYFPVAVPEISLDQPRGSTCLAWDRWDVFRPL